MTTGDAPRRRENPFTLVKRMVSGGVSLAKLEVQRGRQEMAANLGQLKGGVVMLAIAAAILVMFVIALLAFIIAVLVVIGLWWVALILLVVMLAIAGLLAWQGIKKVSSTKFTPEETIAPVKEEIEWAKARLLKRS
ncbi:MAG TPA: phage holin family protein [Candidatus Limnocylindria bacterium]|nr:phage holin family protein [Candidatus Limnocylindria bacterium]